MTQANRWIKVVIAIAGVFYTATALTLISIPNWFYLNIGNFPPFNRHYEGDLGTFLLPMGIGLILAARDPIRNRLFIGVMAVGSLLHMLNHVYDALNEPLMHWAVDVLPLVIFGVVLGMAAWHGGRESADAGISKS
jgi:hypothetical protein